MDPVEKLQPTGPGQPAHASTDRDRGDKKQFSTSLL
jgi:hypothetical protein